MAREIDIRLKTTADLAGFDRASARLKGIGAAAGRLGEAFGGANAYLGRFVQNLARGGVWGMAAELMGFCIRKVQEWRTASERAEREAAKAAKEANAERMRGLDEYSAALDRLAQRRNAAIGQSVKAVNEEIEATRELAKAVLDLERAEARRRGDSGRMAEIDRERDAVDADAARARLENEIGAAQRRRQGGESDLAEARSGKSRADAEVRHMMAAIEDRLAGAAEDARAKAVARPYRMGMTSVMLPATDADRDEAAARAEEAFRKSDEYRDLVAQLREAEKRAAAFGDRIRAAKSAIRESADAERSLSDRLRAVSVREEAKAVDEEARAAEEEAAAEGRRIAEAKAAEVKAAQDAARERERLDRELHQRRMADLREEIAGQANAAAPLRAAANAAQGEFERAFAMYRDPERAAAEIGEERSYARDLDRLHRDAARYGGSWRIDELSRLMAAGDTQGQADALGEWRRSRRFTPEVEAMVRASAAERAKTTAEDELRRIEANTAGLAEKLDELLTMKG